MGFWSDWINFLKHNAKENMKRISITVGALIFLLISSVGLGWADFKIVMYAGLVQTAGIILMSLFGKNSNGEIEEILEETKTEKTPNGVG